MFHTVHRLGCYHLFALYLILLTIQKFSIPPVYFQTNFTTKKKG